MSTVVRPSSLLLLGWFLLSIPALSAGQLAQEEYYSLLQKTVILEGDGTAGPFQLPDRFLLPDGVGVWVDEQLLIFLQDYQLEHNRGLITFTEAPPLSSLIRVQYQRFPFALKDRYFHRERNVQQGQVPPAVQAPIVAASPRTFAPSALRVGGSKTFAVSLGSERDLSLEQSLRVNISGQISPDVEVIALLSDQSSPLQPEGDTQTLEEIDKVLVEIRGKRASATLGDYEISYLEGEFGRFDRKLQGAKGTAQFPGVQATLAGAVSRGTFRTMSFTGVEGKQGPYQLTDDQGSMNIIVLAGTERVWLDGERLTRGQNNDYVIEYGSGQVTFTMHRLITFDSRIVVDYEYSAQNYKQTFYGGHGEVSLLDRKLQMRTMFLRESDDQESPIEIALSDEDREILQQVGDDADLAWKDGWVLVDTSAGEKGDYLWVDSTYFVYVGPDSNGLYNVVFTDVGSELGEYVREFSLEDNLYYYVYMGDGDRRYLPRIYLPLPRSQSMVDFQAEFVPLPTVQLKAELGLSHRDDNIFSEREDGDNVGRGLFLEGQLKQQPLRIGSRGLGHLDLSGRYRSTDDRFQSPGRSEAVEYYRLWDLDRVRRLDSEEVQEISGTYRPLSTAKVAVEFGQLNRGSFFTSTRQRYDAEFTPDRWPHLAVRHELIESERNDPLLEASGQQQTRWTRQGLTTHRTLWRFKPLFAWEGESREVKRLDRLDSGDRYDLYRGGLSTVGWGALAVSTELSYRQDYIYQGSWVEKSLGRSLKNRLAIQNWRSLSLTAEHTRRTLHFQKTAGTNSEVDLIGAKVNYAPLKNAVQVQLDYEVSNTESTQKRRIPVDVGEGKGEYRLEEGEYIPDSDGNWIFRTETLGDSIPVTDLAAGLRLRLAPHRILSEGVGGMKGFLRHLSTDTFVRIDEQTKEKNKMAIYLLQLDKFQQDETTLRGNISLQQDLFLFPERRDIGVRLRYHTADLENNQFVSGGEENLRIDRSLRLDLAPRNQQMLRLEYGHENRYRKVEGVSKSRIRTDYFSTEGTLRPGPSLETTIGLEFRGDRDAVGKTSSRMVSAAPKVAYSFLRQGRLRSEFGWAHVSAEPDGAAISWEMAQGNTIGDNYRWSLGIDYRVNQYVSATLSYSVRSQPGRPTRHLGKAEMRAFF